MLIRRGPYRRVPVRSAQYWALTFSRHIFSLVVYENNHLKRINILQIVGPL